MKRAPIGTRVVCYGRPSLGIGTVVGEATVEWLVKVAGAPRRQRFVSFGPWSELRPASYALRNVKRDRPPMLLMRKHGRGVGPIVVLDPKVPR